MRGNWDRSAYSIYEHGPSADKAEAQEMMRKTLGAVAFHRSNSEIGSMSIAVPALSRAQKPVEWRDMADRETMSSCLYTGNCDDTLMKMQSKKLPVYSERDSRPELTTLCGREDARQSTKSFELVCDGEQILQFGRLSSTRFFLDFQQPFSLLQAFGVVLAALDQ